MAGCDEMQGLLHTVDCLIGSKLQSPKTCKQICVQLTVHLTASWQMSWHPETTSLHFKRTQASQACLNQTPSSNSCVGKVIEAGHLENLLRGVQCWRRNSLSIKSSLSRPARIPMPMLSSQSWYAGCQGQGVKAVGG